MSGDNGAQPQENAIPVEAVEVSLAQSQAVVPVAAPPSVAVVPAASPQDLLNRLKAIEEAQKIAMVKDVDYGEIPGTNKPTLLKPGAEKLAALFQFDVQPQNEKRWEADNHLTVISRVTLFHAPTGARLGSGEGVCTTREKKYGKRQKDRTCPECGDPTIKRSKFPPRNEPDAEPGWYCYQKIGGCGANFAYSDPQIKDQITGEVDNPDLPDLWNTVDKMATKRALVAAVLIVTGASAVFTQDVEDLADHQETAGTEAFQRASAEAARNQRATPETNAHERKPSERPITGDQKGKINQRLGAANLTDAEASALRVWHCAKEGCSHFDRLPSKAASNLINELREDGSGARVILDELKVEAVGGDEVAVKIVSRMEGAESA